MPVPTYDQFIEPILRYLGEHPDGVFSKDAHNGAAAKLGLSEKDMQEMLPSGSQLVYKNRAGWAHDRLKRAGLSTSIRKGFWKISEAGSKYLESHKDKIPKEEVERLAIGFMDVRLRPAVDAVSLNDNEEKIESVISATESPDERLANALVELKKTAAAEVLEALLNVSPGYFEIIVLDLLHKMGYGTSRTDLQRVGGVADGGIDGIISLDKLGLEKVYVQAKRWQNTVGRPEIQAFYGALAGQRASKGVFITTSGYTPHAIDYAKSVEKIVLIDGVRLADLMIDYEIGVSSKTIKIPKIDTDYFDEEST